MLSLKTLSSYGFLAFPLAAAFIALQVLIPTHYAEVTSLSLSTIGGVVLLARLWDTITDPIIGLLSDRTPEQWGRRKLWIWLSIPFISLSTYMLFNPSSDAGIGYLLIWTFAIYVSGTMAIVPLNAWGAELSPDYKQRNRVTGSRAFFGLLGTMAALSIPALLSDNDSINLNDSLSTITLLVITGLIIAAFLISFVSDKYEVSLPANQLRSAISLIKTPSPFRTLLFSFLSTSIANAIPATLFLFYITYVLQAPDYAGPLLFLYFICAAISVPIWVKLASHYGKQRTWHVSILIACLLFMATPFLSEDTFWVYIIIVLATGFTTGCDLIIPSSMNGDLVEWDAATTGHKRPGLFFALWGTTTKLAYALAIGIAFPLLDSFGFSADGDNSAKALSALAWMYGLPCILFKVAALIGMKNYSMTESEYNSLINRKTRSE
jgi:GPH family glycoside/pentoside/hexuronide:cation symporter